MPFKWGQSKWGEETWGVATSSTIQLLYDMRQLANEIIQVKYDIFQLISDLVQFKYTICIGKGLQLQYDIVAFGRTSIYCWDGSSWTIIGQYFPRIKIGTTDYDVISQEYGTVRKLITISPHLTEIEQITVIGGRDIEETFRMESGMRGFISKMKGHPEVDKYGVRLLFTADQQGAIITHDNTIKDALDVTGLQTLSATDCYVLVFNRINNFITGLVFSELDSTSQWKEYQDKITDIYHYTTGYTLSGGREVGIFVIPFPETMFKEGENAESSTGTTTADSLASGGYAEVLDTQDEYVNFIWQTTNRLPKGTYTAIIRAKDTSQVTDDMEVRIQLTDLTYINYSKTFERHTLTSSYAYYIDDFELSVDADMHIRINKYTATANSIYIDYCLVIPRADGKNFPEDIASQMLKRMTIKRSAK